MTLTLFDPICGQKGPQNFHVNPVETFSKIDD